MKSVIESINQNILPCTKCFHTRLDKGLGFGKGTNYVILELTPTLLKESFTTAKENAADWYLWKCLRNVKWPIKETYFTSLIKCIGLPPDHTIASTCAKLWFSQELVAIAPRIIICLGEDTYDYLISLNLWYLGCGETDVVFVKSPLEIVNNSELYDEWKESLKEILK